MGGGRVASGFPSPSPSPCAVSDKDLLIRIIEVYIEINIPVSCSYFVCETNIGSGSRSLAVLPVKPSSLCSFLFLQGEIHANQQPSPKAAVTSVYWLQDIFTQKAIRVTAQQALCCLKIARHAIPRVILGFQPRVKAAILVPFFGRICTKIDKV